MASVDIADGVKAIGRLQAGDAAANAVSKAVDGAARAVEAELFATAGASSGAAWAPLRPETVARKRKMGLSTAILVATGTLKNALTTDGSGHGVEVAATPDGFSVAVSIDGAAARELAWNREGSVPRDADAIGAAGVERIADAAAEALLTDLARQLGGFDR